MINFDRKNKTNLKFKRTTANKIVEDVLKRINDVNTGDFIYKITKAVLFGSYINSNKEYIGDLDLAIYLDLKIPLNEKEKEMNLNIKRYRANSKYDMNFIDQMFYGKIEVFRYIQNRSRMLEIHNGNDVDSLTDINSNYIYLDKYKIIYEE